MPIRMKKIKNKNNWHIKLKQTNRQRSKLDDNKHLKLQQIVGKQEQTADVLYGNSNHGKMLTQIDAQESDWYFSITAILYMLYYTRFVQHLIFAIMKRLEKQFAGLSNMDPDQVTVRQKQNLFHWEVVIKGPVGSPYQGNDLIVDFDFPEQFPFKFPMIKFKTMIWHPNVKDGDICKQMVGQKQWQPNKKVVEIVQSLQSMLLTPDVHSAINLEAAKQYKQGKYEAHARESLKKQMENRKKNEQKNENKGEKKTEQAK